MVKEYIERDMKIAIFEKIIYEANEEGFPCLKNSLIAWAGEQWGTTRRTALEYLNGLEALKKIHIDENEIWTYARWQKILLAREKDFLHMQDILNKQGQTKL